MFCSTIIPTIGRPTLKRTVWSVINQELPSANFEIIVVNDSGHPLPAADWQNSDRVSIINTQRRERSVARNTGAAVARGKYLHFLDDDDWLLPDALQSFWNLSLTSNTAWLYGSSQLVDRSGKPLILLQHNLEGNCFTQIMAGEWIPLQSSLLREDAFFEVGGFNPLITASEDIDLCRRIALKEDLSETNDLIAFIGMGSLGSTTDYERHPILSRHARELILNKSNVWNRMYNCSKQSYWSGRVVRTYLTSVIWNIQHYKFFTASSRLAYSIFSLVISGHHLFSKQFWHAVTRSYESFSFERGFKSKC